jgi:hypothetical protein
VSHSSKRLVVVAVIENIRRVQEQLTHEQCRRASCETSWGKQAEYAECEDVTGINFTPQDKKDRDQALAGYDRKIEELKTELNKWYDALGHALDSLEGRV